MGNCEWRDNRKQKVPPSAEITMNVEFKNETDSKNQMRDKLERRFLTMDELEGYLSLSKRSIYHLISKRELPFIPLSKRLYRFDRIAIDKWMLKRQVQSLSNQLEVGNFIT